MPPGVHGLRADLLDPASLTDLPRDLDAVVYAVSADRSDESAYRDAYVRSLDNLGRALSGTMRRLIFLSSTSVYGTQDGSRVDEKDPARPEGFRGRLVLEGESVARSLAPQSSCLRLGGIYGPGRTRLVARIARGELRLEGGPQYTNRIHRDDAAAAAAHILKLSKPDTLYLGVDRAPADLIEVAGFIAGELGIAAPEAAERPSGAPRGKRCSSDRLQASGFRFRYPSYREGYPAIVAEYLAATRRA
jgi:nucleoside-diphosphate-sugar epimerase